MRSQFLELALLALACALVGALETGSQPPAGPNSVKPLTSLYGRYSKITKPKELRILSEEEWQALWQEHHGEGRNLDFDFNRVMVIALFQGNGSLCSGIEVDSITEERDRLVVRVRHLYFSVTLAAGVEFDIDSQAWGIFALSRSNKQVVLEKDDRVLRDSPPKWVLWKTFPAISQSSRRQ
jgi:hypothetical protein